MHFISIALLSPGIYAWDKKSAVYKPYPAVGKTPLESRLVALHLCLKQSPKRINNESPHPRIRRKFSASLGSL